MVIAGADTVDWITAVATAVAALGTLAAVVLALWLQVWRERRTRPALSLALPDKTFGLSMTSDVTKPFVLTVSNRPEARTAREVEILLSADFVEDTIHYPTSFRDEPLRWLGGDGARIDIPPGVQRRVVVGYVGDARATYQALLPGGPDFDATPKEFRQETSDYAGAFPGHPQTPGDIHWIEPGITYELFITVTAADIEAREYHSEVVQEVRNAAVYVQLEAPTLLG